MRVEVDIRRWMAKSVIARRLCFGADFDASISTRSPRLDIATENVWLTARMRFLLRYGAWTNEAAVCNWLPPEPAVPLRPQRSAHTTQQVRSGTRSIWAKVAHQSKRAAVHLAEYRPEQRSSAFTVNLDA